MTAKRFDITAAVMPSLAVASTAPASAERRDADRPRAAGRRQNVHRPIIKHVRQHFVFVRSAFTAMSGYVAYVPNGSAETAERVRAVLTSSNKYVDVSVQKDQDKYVLCYSEPNSTANLRSLSTMLR